MDKKTRRLVEWFDAQLERIGLAGSDIGVYGIDIVAGSVEIGGPLTAWILPINDARSALRSIDDDAGYEAFEQAMEDAIR